MCIQYLYSCLSAILLASRFGGCIMFFPKFSNMEVIDKLREKYDPLAKHVRPHITLMFPFGSDIESVSLEKHLKAVLSSVKPFVNKILVVDALSLSGI